MELEKCLLLARAARNEGNAEDAKKFYDMVRMEDPLNPEAKFFYQYYSVIDAPNIELTGKFHALCKSFVPTLELIQKMEEPAKREVFEAVTTAFFALPDRLTSHFYSIGFDTSWALEGYNDVLRTARTLFKGLGETIVKLFGDKSPYIDAAVESWKMRIEWRHDMSAYRNFKLKGKELWFDALARIIQIYDPTYVMPTFKQAGIIAGSDAAYAPMEETLAEEQMQAWLAVKPDSPFQSSTAIPAANKQTAGAPVNPAIPASAIPSSDAGDFSALIQLKTLLDQGIITQADYDKKKAEILGLDKKPGKKSGSEGGSKKLSVFMLIAAGTAWLGLIIDVIIVLSIWGYIPAMFIVAKYGYIAGFIVMAVFGLAAIVLSIIGLATGFKNRYRGRIVTSFISVGLVVALGITTLAMLPPSPQPGYGNPPLSNEYELVIRDSSYYRDYEVRVPLYGSDSDHSYKVMNVPLIGYDVISVAVKDSRSFLRLYDLDSTYTYSYSTQAVQIDRLRCTGTYMIEVSIEGYSPIATISFVKQ